MARKGDRWKTDMWLLKAGLLSQEPFSCEKEHSGMHNKCWTSALSIRDNGPVMRHLAGFGCCSVAMMSGSRVSSEVVYLGC